MRNNEKNLLNLEIAKTTTEDVYSMLWSVLHSDENVSIFSLMMLPWITLLCTEVENLYTNITGNSLRYNGRNIIRKTRSRIKPNNTTRESLLSKVSEENRKSYEYFAGLCPKVARLLFPELIDNVGVFRCDSEIISDTIIIRRLCKEFIGKNNAIDEEKIKNNAQNLASMAKSLAVGLRGRLIEIKPKIAPRICSTDYNMYSGHPFKNDLDNNTNIELLNMLSIINFQLLFQSFYEISDMTKIRLAYIDFYRSSKELSMISSGIPGLEQILNKYQEFEETNIRNTMFYLCLPRDLGDVVKGDAFGGTIQKYLHISEKEFYTLLQRYLKETSTFIKNKIALS